MKKLISIIVLVALFSCESKQVEPAKFQCSFQMTNLLLPVGNSNTIEIRGEYTSQEIVDKLNGNFDMYLINCVKL
jgi:hypothetical protein